MPEMLSQEDLEKLYKTKIPDQLQKKEQKNKEEHKVDRYNFQRPTRFNKDQIRTIQLLHETFAGLLHNLISSYLRCMVSVNLIAVEQLIYSEYVTSVVNPSLINIITMEPLKGEAIIDINQSLVFGFIDRLLGGAGFNYEKNREFTDIEKVIMKKVIDEILIPLDEAWKHVIDLKTKLKKVETNPQFVQIISPEESVVLITIEIKVDQTSGLINICLPYPILESIQMKLSSKNWFAFKDKLAIPKKDIEIEKKINTTTIEMRAFLGTILANVRDVLSLEPGDIIKLDTKVNDSIQVELNGIPKFYANVGVLHNKNSIQIQRKITQEERVDI